LDYSRIYRGKRKSDGLWFIGYYIPCSRFVNEQGEEQIGDFHFIVPTDTAWVSFLLVRSEKMSCGNY